MRIGIDVGSTTVKVVCFDLEQNMVYKCYKRHFSKVEETLLVLLDDAHRQLNFDSVQVTMAGSAGMDMAFKSHITFVQEVIAATLAVKTFLSPVDSVIEIGGEDVKVIFFDTVIDQRMNSTCAGGTGAFIDQMAKLLDITPVQLNGLALKYDKIYPIASRCGVFAKTDIQALINQGVKKENIAMSVFQAVVNQTIAGLAQGRVFKGKVCFLGGPLTFFSALRMRFKATLNLGDTGIVFPDDAEFFIAMGCALFAATEATVAYHTVRENLAKKVTYLETSHRLEPLFATLDECKAFKKKHSGNDVARFDLASYQGSIYIGIDAGSTTTKVVVIGEKDELLYSHYTYNKGSVIDVVKHQLIEILTIKHAKSVIRSTGVTGYGEALIQIAFSLDIGEVETIAHFEAAKHFLPEVDFIIDIGGQDMKCLKIKDGAIESIVLNEACSSGCGSFISTFAGALDYSVEEFSKLALDSKNPVDLGSRCTIFMNSSVKQAQKEGAKVEDISAGLAISVVKNALYKVLRMNRAEDLGKNIVVQGGTFYNDAILRAFERETGAHCIRPSIAGLMGAYGIALIAKKRQGDKSSIMNIAQIKALTLKNSIARCKRCSNACSLTVTSFSNGTRYISGNRCELGLGKDKKSDAFNSFAYKLELLTHAKTGQYKDVIGMPLVLNNYENVPFWLAFFDALQIQVVLTAPSTRETYELGQHTIPSDTACYPAKIVHGHIEELINQGLSKIFYPSIVFNFKEKDHPKNHYNCPVVASYPEVIQNNAEGIKSIQYQNPYLTLNDKRAFCKIIKKSLDNFKFARGKHAVARAYQKGLEAYFDYKQKIVDYGRKAITSSIAKGEKIIVLCGRPYHLDPEINHGIDDLITSLKANLITEDVVSSLANHDNPTVLNQWTYHTRLYDAAKYVAEHPYANMQLIQLVSFGCGLDAITTDEVSHILEKANKLYTQIKIDEMSNLGAVKIRLRSLLSTMEDRKTKHG